MKKLMAVILVLVMTASCVALTSCDETGLGLQAFVAADGGLSSLYEEIYEEYGSLYIGKADVNAQSDVELTLKSTPVQEINEILPATIKGSSVYNINAKKASLVGTASVAGLELVSEMYVNDGYLYMKNSLSEKYYRFTLDTAADMTLAEKLQALSGALENLKAAVSENVKFDDFTSEKAEVVIDGIDVDVQRITLEFDEERLAEIAAAYKAKADEERLGQIQALYEILKELGVLPEEAVAPATVEEMKEREAKIHAELVAAVKNFKWETILKDGQVINETVSFDYEGKTYSFITNNSKVENGFRGSFVITVKEGEDEAVTLFSVNYANDELENESKSSLVIESGKYVFTVENSKTADGNKLIMKWAVDGKVVCSIEGLYTLEYVKNEKANVWFDGVLTINETEFAFEIKAVRDVTGEAVLEIPEIADEDCKDVSAIIEKIKAAKDKNETGKLGEGKIDINIDIFN